MTPLPPTQSDDLAAEPPDPQAHSTSDAHQLLLELGELWAAPDNAHKARLAGLRRVQTFFGAVDDHRVKSAAPLRIVTPRLSPSFWCGP